MDGSSRIFNYYIVSILLAFTCFHGSYHFGRFLSSYNIFCVMAFLCSLSLAPAVSCSLVVLVVVVHFFSFVVIEMFHNILCTMILSAANPFLVQCFPLYNPPSRCLSLSSSSIRVFFSSFAVCVSILFDFFLCI